MTSPSPSQPTTIHGEKALRRRLDRLERKDVKRIGRKAINRGLTIVARGIRQAAPGRQIKKVIGKRNKRNRRKGIQEAKAGVGVGKKAAFTQATAWYAHFVAAGTKNRTITGRGKIKAGANRGRVKPQPFVRRGAAARQSQARYEIIKTLNNEFRKLGK